MKSDLTWLIEAYFSEPERMLRFEKDQVVLEQGAKNDRLFYIHSGVLRGVVSTRSGKSYELFRAGPGMFAGLHSFFSTNSIAASTVLAVEDTEVCYITRNHEPITCEWGSTLVEQFFPVAVEALVERQHREQKQGFMRERTLKKLVETEKLASLGQMAAGLAHELNNAIAVLGRTVEFVSQSWENTLEHLGAENLPYFRLGIFLGRRHAKAAIRAKAKELGKARRLDDESAKKLAELVLEMGDMGANISQMKAENIATAYEYFDIGASLYDAQVASVHAAHVVRSVKSLAAKRTSKDLDLNVNTTIEESFALLRSGLREVTLEQELGELPPICASHGELVQIWTNVIKNACESLVQAHTVDPVIRVGSREEDGMIVVSIEDNGPGIPGALLGRIFQPDVSTKAEGLSFGLGLGLTIVQRIVQSYNGRIEVSSQPGETCFTVFLPLGDSDGKA